MTYPEGGMPLSDGHVPGQPMPVEAVVDGQPAAADLIVADPDAEALESWLNGWHDTLDEAGDAAEQVVDRLHEAAVAAREHPGERKKVKVVEGGDDDEDGIGDRSVRWERKYEPSKEEQAALDLQPDVVVRRIMRDCPSFRELRNWVRPSAWAAWALPHSVKESTRPEDGGIIGWTILSRQIGENAVQAVVAVPEPIKVSDELREGMAAVGLDLDEDEATVELPAAKAPAPTPATEDAPEHDPKFDRERVVLTSDGKLLRIVTPDTETSTDPVTYAAIRVRDETERPLGKILGGWRVNRERKMLEAYRDRNQQTTPPRRPWRRDPQQTTNYELLPAKFPTDDIRSIGFITVKNLRKGIIDLGEGDQELTAAMVWDALDDFRAKHDIELPQDDAPEDDAALARS